MTKEIIPPWIQYPGFPPADTFWRQSGEAWLMYVWEPFWNSLTMKEKEDYLQKWPAPEVWLDYSPFLNPEFSDWLMELDDKDESL